MKFQKTIQLCILAFIILILFSVHTDNVRLSAHRINPYYSVNSPQNAPPWIFNGSYAKYEFYSCSNLENCGITNITLSEIDYQTSTLWKTIYSHGGGTSIYCNFSNRNTLEGVNSTILDTLKAGKNPFANCSGYLNSSIEFGAIIKYKENWVKVDEIHFVRGITNPGSPCCIIHINETLSAYSGLILHSNRTFTSHGMAKTGDYVLISTNVTLNEPDINQSQAFHFPFSNYKFLLLTLSTVLVISIASLSYIKFKMRKQR